MNQHTPPPSEDPRLDDRDAIDQFLDHLARMIARHHLRQSHASSNKKNQLKAKPSKVKQTR